MSALRSAALYQGWVREAIVAFKYHDEWARTQHLGALLHEPLQGLSATDLLTPVPLHPARERQRGYNQSELLCRRLADETGLPMATLLVRTRSTVQQVGLSGDERRRNVADAFAVAPTERVRGRHIVLIDDVTTTGSTLGACALPLWRAGAASVTGLTVARQIERG